MKGQNYLSRGAFAAETLDLSIAIDLVVLEHSQLGLLALVLDLLRGGVDLLLAFFTTTTQAEHQVEGRLLLDVVIRKGAAVLELLAGEDQALLVRRDTLLVCGNLCVSSRGPSSWNVTVHPYPGSWT
jgi:hypothetical protein